MQIVGRVISVFAFFWQTPATKTVHKARSQKQTHLHEPTQSEWELTTET